MVGWTPCRSPRSLSRSSSTTTSTDSPTARISPAVITDCSRPVSISTRSPGSQPPRRLGDDPPLDVDRRRHRRPEPPAVHDHEPPAASGRSPRWARTGRSRRSRRPDPEAHSATDRRDRRPGPHRARRRCDGRSPSPTGSMSAAYSSPTRPSTLQHRRHGGHPAAQLDHHGTVGDQGERPLRQELGPDPGHEHPRTDRHPSAAERHPAQQLLERLAGHPGGDQSLEHRRSPAAASTSSAASSSANTQPAARSRTTTSPVGRHSPAAGIHGRGHDLTLPSGKPGAQ